VRAATASTAVAIESGKRSMLRTTHARAAEASTAAASAGLIDRLERAGFVRRIADAQDRRKVLVEVRPGSMDALDAMFRPVRETMTALLADYDGEDLVRFAEFLERAADASTACLAQINGASAG